MRGTVRGERKDKQMKVNIDINEFISKDEIKKAVLSEIQNLVRIQFSGSEVNLNRLIANLSCTYVFDMVNQQFSGELETILKNKITDVINGLSTYSVFKRKDAWEREESVAYIALQEEMTNARPLIKNRVEQIINEYPFNELDHDEIGEVVYQCVTDRLFGKERTSND